MIAAELSHMLGKPLFMMLGSDDLGAEDLAVNAVVSPDPERRIEYVASPLVSAMLHPGGAVFLLDEINRARPMALTHLASVLDQRRAIDCTLVGGRVTATPEFFFLAAANASDVGSAQLPGFLDSRLRPAIHVRPASKGEIEGIIKSRYGNLRDRLAVELEPLLESFWGSWRALDRAGRPPTARDAITVFALALGLRRGDERGERGGHAVALASHHIEEAVDAFFSAEIAS
jgi:MoxR-like ATPase